MWESAFPAPFSGDKDIMLAENNAVLLQEKSVPEIGSMFCQNLFITCPE